MSGRQIMAKCVECLEYGKGKGNQEVYPCALCGELRCMDHTIWVPAHDLERTIESVINVYSLLKGKKQSGWYTFCGKGTHIPRGLPIRHGKELLGGKIVEPVIDGYKKKGLEFFRMWETGLIEAATDKKWDPQHYSLSCSLAASMVTMSNLVTREGLSVPTFEKVFMTAITGMTAKKAFFFPPSYDEFISRVEKIGGIKSLAEYICSRCAIVPCTNRLAEFYNSKMFKKLIKQPLVELLKK
ncbi:MAG: hypothetical protein P1Q69_15925 [Candidatus Thorarchaeota archaeon]|nr:hypothetical protein [Candidatus Thorarchaeota archaeon]